MIYSERTARNSFVISTNGEVEKLNRIPFMTESYNEEWLQNILADYPSVLPSNEISSEYSPLVCIGREVPVGSGDTKGFIDNLYVSSSGKIVIVETKLFRNQESRRTVVAQIIDYAKELQKWDCEKLNEIASDYFLKKEGQASNIIDVMARNGYCNFSDESFITDSINKSLSEASFLLMIVGDGIRSNVQQLADFLNENTSMSFNLALAEVEIYKSGYDIILIPNLITKTTVIERRYISSKPEKKTSNQKPPILSRRDFISVFSDNGGFDPDEIAEFVSDMESLNGLTVGMAPTELTIRFCPGGERTYALLTFGISCNHSDLWIVPSIIKSALEESGNFPFYADRFLDSFKPYIDIGRCKHIPYEIDNSFYYSDVSGVLRDSSKIISFAEQFISDISANEV